MNDVTILHGDALTMLRSLPSGSVQCCVTSPPYYGLRDYGTATWIGGDPACEHRPGGQSRVGKTTLGGGTATAGHQHEGYRAVCGKCGATRQDAQIGLEPTVGAYVARLVEVFEEVRRVLRDDGTLWLNLGDSYVSNASTTNIPRAEQGNGTGIFCIPSEERLAPKRQSPNRATPLTQSGLKMKDLIGVPWRVAFALQDAGWWLRADIIWAKKAPMPESVTDRPTRSHEHVFLLTKNARYFYDQEAVKEAVSVASLADGRTERGKRGTKGEYAAVSGACGFNPSGRNQRDVWTLGEPMARLRNDLTPEQRAYVLERLAAHERRGLP
jgi:DNA modification methylase